MSALARQAAQTIAAEVVTAFGGKGLFGVELFICGDDVIFSEVSPCPHDTGMVTLISQDLSEFALHVRAFLGLPISTIRQYAPAASAVILPELQSDNVSFSGLENALAGPGNRFVCSVNLNLAANAVSAWRLPWRRRWKQRWKRR